MAKSPVNDEVIKKEATNNYVTISRRHGWLYGLLALIALLLVFMAGIGIANHDRWGGNIGMVRRSSAVNLGGGQDRLMMHRGFASNITVNGQTRDSGVVTGVNGSNFTIAGNGATTNVITNSSTQYQGGNTVKQNDTVVVFGTESNGTLTATQIIINP